jgi:asparagine synthase (glutamine-hydrolysing)
MCGIAGIFAYHHTARPVDREELRAIRDHMSARGPDGMGEWYSSDNRVGLAHRRLSIIDLTDHAAQPMASSDGRLVISFNGEIYNYRQLRTVLEGKGYIFRSHSDTEVLLHLYADKGIGMLNDLRGMFAFALWDSRVGQLFLARDPYGIKPLYFAHDGHTLRAASQVKALLAGGAVSRQLEPAAVAGFYLMGSVPEPWTLYQNTKALPAGSYLCADSQGVSEPRPYCDIAAILAEASCTTCRPSESEALELIHAALRDSVRAHLVSDVPVGLFLSSGIDSGALAGLSAQDQKLEAITLGFDEYAGTPADEVPLAAEIAAHYCLRHRVERIGQDDFLAQLPKIMSDMDQPSIDGINTWLVSRAAAHNGWKVALSGVGGDELLGGYPSFQDIPRWVNKLALPSRLPLLGSLFHGIVSRLAPYTPGLSPKFAGLLNYGGNHAGAYLLKRGLFLPEDLPAIMGEEMAAEGLRHLTPLPALNRPLHGRTWHGEAFKVSAMESSLYMRNQLLRDTDWAGMAHSLEIRTPLVDIDLLKRVAPALAALGHHKGKQALASAPAKPLPEHIRLRPKTGFTVPIGRWQQQDRHLDAWRKVPALRHERCPWGRRWAYTLMQNWQDQS